MIRFLRTFLFIGIASFATAADRPNIVLILCDDLGYGDVGFHGAQDIQTPQLDALAEGGIICTSGYVAHPFCGPSRMGLMTGRYPHAFGAPFNLPGAHHGMTAVDHEGIPEGETTLSESLQQAGYHTGAIGKWHLGASPAHHPNQRGFDHFYGFLGGGHQYFPEEYRPLYEKRVKAGVKRIHDYVTPLECNGKAVRESEYLTDAFSREAERFIRDAAPKEQPFFLYLAYNAPHSPLEAKEDDLSIFASLADDDRRTYAAMVYAVDRGVGRVVDALKDTKTYEDTLIIFLSDNGGNESLGADNGALREGKGSVFEGGHRVPMVFHWPDHIPSGRKIDYPVSTLDFYPTLLGLAKTSIPRGKVLDGIDLWEAFLTDRLPSRTSPIFTLRHRLGYSDAAARRDQWKICRAYDTKWKLYNLDHDLSESRDLSHQHPERVREMVALMERWSRGLPEPRWFDSPEVQSNWEETAMPHYDETFEINR